MDEKRKRQGQLTEESNAALSAAIEDAWRYDMPAEYVERWTEVEETLVTAHVQSDGFRGEPYLEATA